MFNYHRVLSVSAVLLLVLVPIAITAQIAKNIGPGIQLFDAKNFTAAKEFFQAYTHTHQTDPVAAAYLARIFLQAMDYAQAIPLLEKAIQLDAKNSNYHLWLANAYGIKAQHAGLLKRPGAARNVKKEFERAVALNPDNLEARFGLLQFHCFAPGIMGGDKTEARTQAREVRQRNAHQGHLAYGFLYTFTDAFDSAAQEYQAAFKTEPADVQPYYALSQLYAHQKKYAQAWEILQNLLKSHPQEEVVYFYLGRLAMNSARNLDQGEAYLQRYLQTTPASGRPTLAATHLLLGYINQMQGRVEPAKSEFKKALALNPDYKQAREALGKLDD
jgi:tetratricopeptide (TPR) repeat protein